MMLHERHPETKKPKQEKPAIIVNNVSKEFIISHERKTTLFENIKGVFKPSMYEKFIALENVSFCVEPGEFIGIIGDNGSGKSTLLKIITRIIKPTSGGVNVNGKVTPFLELGVGFQPDLTAKENIELYSTIMGLTSNEIAKNMDSILDFSGLKKFKDTKLKNFSSGMQVKLAFATAIQRKPDILLVDEVLAVGDIDFQQKCLDVFTDYKKKGVTMLFVSHDLSAVRRFCDKTLLLNNGKVVAFDKTGDVIDRYIYRIDKNAVRNESAVEVAQTDQCSDAWDKEVGTINATGKEARWGNHKVVINDIRLYDKYGNENTKINSGDPLTIKISYMASEPVNDLVIGVIFYSENDILCYGSNTDIEGLDMGTVHGKGAIDIRIPAMTLLSGKFFITVAAHGKDNTVYDWLDKKYAFTVFNSGRKIGIVDIKNDWNIK